MIFISFLNFKISESKINYSNYIKYYYHIPSYNNIEISLKSNFYDYVVNNSNLNFKNIKNNYDVHYNVNKEEIKYYTNKLDKLTNLY